jgi:hypothetical protein
LLVALFVAGEAQAQSQMSGANTTKEITELRFEKAMLDPPRQGAAHHYFAAAGDSAFVVRQPGQRVPLADAIIRRIDIAGRQTSSPWIETRPCSDADDQILS